MRKSSSSREDRNARQRYRQEIETAQRAHATMEIWPDNKPVGKREYDKHLREAVDVLQKMRQGTCTEAISGEMSDDTWNRLHDNREKAQAIARTFLLHPRDEVRREAIRALRLHSNLAMNQTSLRELLANERNENNRFEAWSVLIHGATDVELEVSLTNEIRRDNRMNAGLKAQLLDLVKRQRRLHEKGTTF